MAPNGWISVDLGWILVGYIRCPSYIRIHRSSGRYIFKYYSHFSRDSVHSLGCLLPQCLSIDEPVAVWKHLRIPIFGTQVLSPFRVKLSIYMPMIYHYRHTQESSMRNAKQKYWCPNWWLHVISLQSILSTCQHFGCILHMDPQPISNLHENCCGCCRLPIVLSSHQHLGPRAKLHRSRAFQIDWLIDWDSLLRTNKQKDKKNSLKRGFVFTQIEILQGNSRICTFGSEDWKYQDGIVFGDDHWSLTKP